MPRSHSLRTLLFVSIAVAGLLVAACGDNSETSDTDSGGDATVASAPAEALNEGSAAAAEAPPSSHEPAVSNGGGSVSSDIAAMAMLRTQELDSLRFAMVIGMTGLPGYDGEVELTMDGAIDQTNNNFEMSLDFGAFMEAMAVAEGQTAAEAAMVAAFFGDGRIEMRQVGDTAYMRWPALSALFGAQTDWISFPADDAIESSFNSSELLGSPELLDELASIGSVTNLGTEQLRGVSTTHYEALIDYGTAYASLSSGAPVPLDAPDATALAGLSIPLGLWIDEDGLVRRMRMDFDTASLGLAAEELAGAPGSISLQFDILEVGGTVVVQAPPAADVTDMTGIDGGQPFGGLF